MKRWITWCMMAILLVSLTACSQTAEQVDPAILKKLNEAYEYMKTLGPEGMYQTMIINDGNASTIEADIWKDEDRWYSVSSNDADARYLNVTVIDKEGQSVFAWLKKSSEGLKEESYTFQNTQSEMTDPLLCALSTVLRFDEQGNVTGLDPDYRYELDEDGKKVRFVLKDLKEAAKKQTEVRDQWINDTDRYIISKDEGVIALDRYDHLISIRTDLKTTIYDNSGTFPFDQETIVTKNHGGLSAEEKDQIEEMADAWFDEAQ